MAVRKAFSSVTPGKFKELFLRPLSLSPNATSSFSLVICGPAMKVGEGCSESWSTALQGLPGTLLLGGSQAAMSVLQSSQLTGIASQLFTSTAGFFAGFMAPYLITNKSRSPRMPCGNHRKSILTTLWLSFAEIRRLSCSCNIGSPCTPFFSLSVPMRLHPRLLVFGSCVWRPKLAKSIRQKTAANVELKIQPSVSSSFQDLGFSCPYLQRGCQFKQLSVLSLLYLQVFPNTVCA